MEAEVKHNVTTTQTNKHKKRKEKMHNEFSLEGKTVDRPIISQQFVVHHTGIALLKLRQRKKYLHTRMRF